MHNNLKAYLIWMAGFGMIVLFYFRLDLEAGKAKTGGQLREEREGGASFCKGRSRKKGTGRGARSRIELPFLCTGCAF